MTASSNMNRMPRIASVRGLAVALVGAMAILGCGSSAPSLPLSLTIETYPEGPSFDGDQQNAMLVAFQDGEAGQWQALTGSKGVYHATLTQERYAVAMGCIQVYPDSGQRLSNLTFSYLTVRDNPDIKLTSCDGMSPRVHLSVTVNGASGGSAAVAAGATNLSKNAASGAYEGDVVQGEPAAALVRLFENSSDSTGEPSRVYRGPTLDTTADQAVQYDLSSVGAAPVTEPLSVVGRDPADDVEVISFLINDRAGLSTSVSQQTPDAGTAVDHYSTVPVAAGRQPDDLSEIVVLASQKTASVGGSTSRSAFVAMTNPAAATLTLPEQWSADPPAITGISPFQVSVTFPVSEPILQAVDYDAVLLGGGASHEYFVYVSATWADGESNVTVTTPDLSNLPGWTSELEMTSDSDIQWVIQRSDRNMVRNAPLVDGWRIVTNVVSGSIPASVQP
ncbi:MAG TPA: hypothetical protein VH165_07685 [Kofleriaceae bacterium]|nr:hypothetical protein [Kofleriaceae bacterium]